MKPLSVKQRMSLEQIAQKYSLELVLLFGSRVSGKIHKESDFDIAYSALEKLDLTEEARLILDLSSVFQSENIDLVNLKNASPLLLFAITKDALVLFEKKSLTFYHLRAYAFHQYIETKPLYEEKFKRLEARAVQKI